MYVCMYVQGMYVCMHACMHACMHVCTMHVLCMHACMHVCIYCMYVSIITWCLERYGHFDDVILSCQNLYHAYSIGGATHTLS